MAKKEYDQSDDFVPENPEASDVSDTDNDPELELGDMESAEPSELEAEIEELQNKLAESNDKYLRLSAEFDNYRKRTLREKAELIQTAGESILKDILPFLDDFDRGLEMIDNSTDTKSVKTGILLIHNKLKDFLANKGVREIEAMNEPFDAEHHEAVTNIPAPSEEMKGKVVDVIQKGYTLHDKIIRYPKVVVGE